MIKDKDQLKTAQKLVRKERSQLRRERAVLRSRGLAEALILEIVSSRQQKIETLQKELFLFNAFRKSKPQEVRNFDRFGQMLIAARVGRGLTQVELAERLGVNPSQVCRDEKSEYKGITLERAAKILAALGMEVRSFLSKTARSTAQGGER